MAGLSPPTRDCLPGKPVKHFVQPVCKINTTTEALFVCLTKKKKKMNWEHNDTVTYVSF